MSDAPQSATPAPSTATTAPALTTAPAEVTAHNSATPQPGLAAPTSSGAGRTALLVIGLIIGGLVMLFVIVYVISGLGVDAFALGGIMALIPLAIVFIGVRWIDKWEPEPRGVVIFAFLWGAGVSVLIALLVGAEIDNVINGLGGPGPGYEFFSAAIQAPVVEETAKGLGLLLIFWFARRHFDGPVDGLVYAAWVAGGFAFTENILYFGSQLVESGGIDGDVFQIFLIRGLMSPFAHVMFTACTGFALGLAASRVGAFGAIGFWLLGLIPAMLLHALWNGSLFFVSDFFGYYAIVQFPLFGLAVWLVIYLRRKESKLTHERLSEYAAAGWFNPDEIDALATPVGRRQAKAWAATQGKSAEMRRYIRESTRLAFARQRIIAGRGRDRAQLDEAALLVSIVESRNALVGA